ncbi:MAG: YdcF family protein [Bacteroidetes bacterium]|nr:YdcF family protein [Bacteroidota bacterium]
MISFFTKDRIYKSVESLPKRKIAIVLGAGNYEPDLWINYHFNERMSASFQLLAGKKAEKIIVSGLELPGVYSEPDEMRQVLVKYGVADSIILSDTQGLRTWASIRRVKEYFESDSIIIISQQGQLERAIFSASCLGIHAIGFVAKEPARQHRLWMLREYLARVKCIVDCIAYHLKIT